MIEDFSDGYYRTILDVESYDDGPVIGPDLYDYIDSVLYANSDNPVTMRLDLSPSPNFVVSYEGSVPTGMLAMPSEMFGEAGATQVFIVKPGYVGEIYG